MFINIFQHSVVTRDNSIHKIRPGMMVAVRVVPVQMLTKECTRADLCMYYIPINDFSIVQR